ncbi:Na+/H+ antiporter [Pedobacter sp. UYP30]|uniref:Na+/H+ antiporter n=1 Tax=Pedobacter sp. UYP30 TaxID=1756400 RepID=UPI00339B33D8
MENYSIILSLLGLMIFLSAIAEKLKLSSPILLIAAGIVLSVIPGVPEISIDPEIIFLLFLPPLLYDAAFNLPFKDFKEHLGTISSMAFGLVFLTTAGIALIAYYMIPGMTWELSFLLGAILAATDAVAAISITKNLELSHNTKVILEGESLINDASALVAYKFALAAVMGSAFLIWKAALSFLILLAGGAVIGIIIAFVLARILKIVKDNSTAVTSFIVLTPFITYLIAEELKVSGVIAVVILGFGISKLSKMKFSDPLRQQSKNIWDVIIFLLNGLIFILIGLELRIVIKNFELNALLWYSLYAFIITVVAIILRTLRVFLKMKSSEFAYKKYKTVKFNNKMRNFSENILLSVRESLIISWSGMRGIVSLTIAIALPQYLRDGTQFPMRDPILFITCMVILFSIVGQGLILPIFIKRSTTAVIK